MMQLEDNLNEPRLNTTDSIVDYVLNKAEMWRSFLTSNYTTKWDEYNRIWRGIWDASDKTREAERSRIVTPATQQAVESSVCDVEEATFGSGKYFDIRDDSRDAQGQDIELLKKLLTQEFIKNKVRSACCEVLIEAAVTGTGIAEVVVEEIQSRRMGTQPVMEGQMTAFGVYTENKVAVFLKPVLTKNFYIDPVASSVASAHGCIVDEFVPMHQVLSLQASGAYKDVPIGTATTDTSLEPDPELAVQTTEDKVRITKYFGLVPKYLLEFASMTPEELVDAPETRDETLVESVVVIANEETLLKAEESPYMMQDRPIVAFQWDTIPGLFHGRGVVEKGYNPQKALDAEIRARIDALALTVHPMMGIDATRIPRGHKPEVRAGRNIYTTGNPRDVLMPFNLGEVSQITFAQAEALQQMVQQATGAMDGAAFAEGMGSNNKTGAVSMALGSIIKRQKRTLLNFHENFWIPFVEKAAWRYMQFDPENFPVKDYQFVPQSTLGLMAREYEVSQLIQLLQTTSDQSPLYPAIVMAIVDNMNLENREQLKEVLKQAAQIPPEEQKRIQEEHQMEMAMKQGQIKFAHAQAYESQMRGDNYKSEAAARPQELRIKQIEAVTKNLQPGAGEDTEFVRRLKIAEIALKERDLNIKEQDLKLSHEQAKREAEYKRQLDESMEDTE